MKHTPAPWKATYSKKYNDYTITGNDRLYICMAVTRPEDASLIEAAPDLYEALKQLTQAHWDFIKSTYKHAVSSDTLDLAKAALLKANPQIEPIK